MSKFLHEKENLPAYGQNAVASLHFDHTPNSLCFSMHWHNSLELIRIQKGYLNLYLGETSPVLVYPGEVVIICPQQVHCGIAGAEGVTYDVLIFELSSFFNNVPSTLTILKQIATSRLIFDPICDNSAVVCAFDVVHSSGNAAPLDSLSAVYALLGQMLLHCNPRAVKLPPNDARFSRVIDYVNNHFLDSLSTRSVSRLFGYDEAYFCRRFKWLTGITFLKYVESLRLEEAQTLLCKTDLAISHIALQCGFSNICYFSSRFCRHFGVSPSVYRKQFKPHSP